MEPWLVNARDVKHLPGRPKTDGLDAVWLCKVAERQMLRPSFVPPADIRRLRDLTRYRVDLVGVRTAEKNRVEKLLEDACIKLSVVASDIFGVSGREMMAALIAGERDPKMLAEMARTRMRTKIPQLEEAFAGLRLGTSMTTTGSCWPGCSPGSTPSMPTSPRSTPRSRTHLAPFADAVARLDEIPGIGPVAAAVIIAEIGVDMTRFPTPGHLASWAKFAPGSTPPPARPRATAPPDTATATSPGSWARPRSAPAEPTPSSAPATDGSPDAAARRRPSSPSADPSWSSSGTCSPTPTPGSTTSARTTTTATSTPRQATQPHPPTRSPRLHRHPRTRSLTVTSTGPGICLVTSIFGLASMARWDADAGVKTWAGLPVDADAFLVFEAAD